MTFYQTIPGLEVMGPFNQHFIRDVGLAFVASGAAMLWGTWTCNRGVVIAGAMWPAMHGAFHMSIQIGRGLPGDLIMWFDFLAVIAPAFLALFAAVELQRATNE